MSESIDPASADPSTHAGWRPRRVLTCPSVPATGCHVRMPDITTESHLLMGLRLALTRAEETDTLPIKLK